MFIFASAAVDANADRIADFVRGQDKIGLENTIFTALGPTIEASELRVGTAAVDANDFLIFQGTTGRLFYDPDANGGGGARLVAKLTGITTLAVSDFVLV